MSDLVKQAFSYVTVVLGQLNADGRDMLVVIMQACRDEGYTDGCADAQKQYPQSKGD